MIRWMRLLPATVALSIATLAARIASAGDAAAPLGVDPAAASAPPLLQPSTLVLVGLGLVGLAVFRARAQNHREK